MWSWLIHRRRADTDGQFPLKHHTWLLISWGKQAVSPSGISRRLHLNNERDEKNKRLLVMFSHQYEVCLVYLDDYLVLWSWIMGRILYLLCVTSRNDISKVQFAFCSHLSSPQLASLVSLLSLLLPFLFPSFTPWLDYKEYRERIRSVVRQTRASKSLPPPPSTASFTLILPILTLVVQSKTDSTLKRITSLVSCTDFTLFSLFFSSLFFRFETEKFVLVLLTTFSLYHFLVFWNECAHALLSWDFIQFPILMFFLFDSEWFRFRKRIICRDIYEVLSYVHCTTFPGSRFLFMTLMVSHVQSPASLIQRTKSVGCSN